MRYFIRLAYDGTPFAGWQRQPNGLSVQEVLEAQLSTVLREDVAITGCGRTDTGVHARQYYAHFDTDKELPANLVYSLNALVGPAIAIQEVAAVANDLHARFNAKNGPISISYTSIRIPSARPSVSSCTTGGPTSTG